jgi:diguanylate cyclase (GGDEF)-like protein
MTLLNQINSLLFTLFLLIMSSLLYFQFTETKAFMVNQMDSDLNNTLTSLSLSLKPHLETGDEATVNTLVNVIFEGGFYKKVTLTWLADQREKVWENKLAVNEVPLWFSELQLFNKHSKEVTITSGWLQLATLKIESNPAMGYQELWRIMNDTVMVFAALFLFSFIVLRLRLRKILKPLYEVAKHARDVSQRKFHSDVALPSTLELQEVVVAVNSMSGQLKHVFNALDEEIESLKKNTLWDEVSQLPNRLYLTGQLNSWLSEPDFGALLLADFTWLEEVHSKYGYRMRDKTIRTLAKKFTEELPSSSESLVARISNTEFVFLVRQADKEQVSEYLQLLIRLINQQILNSGLEPNQKFAIGIAERSPEITRIELLSQADNALQKALNDHKVSHWFYQKTEKEFGREAWRKQLDKAIRNNDFLFKWQPVQQCSDNKIIHREIYCRLELEGNVLQAGQFMPYVEQLSLGYQLDMCLLESINAQSLLTLNSDPIAINLSRKSISTPDFHLWLTSYLKQVSKPQKIHFEVSESGITQHLPECIQLCEIIRSSGAKFGVDNCGRQMGSLAYLQELKPDYIKLDMSLSCYNNEKDQKNHQNLELCRALVNIGRGLNINVIVTGIEDAKHLKTIMTLRADGYQGYILPPVDVAKCKPHEPEIFELPNELT